MKFLNSVFAFAIIFAALCILCTHYGGWQASGIHYTTQINGLGEWLPIIGILSFFLGFIPAFIHESLQEMRPATVEVGQQYSFDNCNCSVRIKSVKLA